MNYDMTAERKGDILETPVRKIPLRHLALLTVAILFSWVLWIAVNMDVYSRLSGKELFIEILTDLGEQAVETTIMLEIALLYIRGIVRLFWNARKTLVNLAAQVTLLALLNGLSSILIGKAYEAVYPDERLIFAKVLITCYINLSILTTAYLVRFLTNRYHEETESRLRSRLAYLTSQTNKHFIFNSFATLSWLMKEAPEQAEDFLQALSGMIRFLLVNGDKSIVHMKDELAFVADYVKLNCYRFSGIEVTIDGRLQGLDAYVCPVSIQGLVENAVKHNRHGKDSALSVEIALDGDRIVVSNNLLPRSESPEGTGRGLSTLRERYSLLTDKKVSVTSGEDRFEVSIPIIYSEDLKNESFDH